uniref:Uncharacterized protein n=1 Tax=Setaria viridis TaxID=4556 RepID=A0A4U6WQN7_SETVI|nr:hypothetical protein SEVIR_1G301950v2 [Setaria viridis]
MNKGKACMSHHFLCVCMCVSSAWHQLDADYAEPEQKILLKKARQIWTTALKALHFFSPAWHLPTEGLSKPDPARAAYANSHSGRYPLEFDHVLVMQGWQCKEQQDESNLESFPA